MGNVSFYKALADSPRSIEITEMFFVGFYATTIYCGLLSCMI